MKSNDVCGGKEMIELEIWLYGPLAKYAGDENKGGYAQLFWEMPEGTKMRDLLNKLGIPSEERGITFINGQLTNMPGLSADLDRELRNGDRIALFSPKSMWPFQYRFGAGVSPELREAMKRRESGGIHHSYTTRTRR